jgi:Protein of unknown function (DUF3306)
VTQEKEAFLDRWSRLKREQAAEPPVAAEPVQAAEAAEEPVPSLPPLEQLKPDSDFTPFMHPKVDPATRRSALKKLFADAHYNLPDPFEAYSEDYTRSEPIPEQMLRAINRARDLAVKGPEKVAEEERLAAEEERLALEERKVEAQEEIPKGKPDDVAGRQDA